MVPYADGIFPTPSGKFRFMTAFEPGLLGQADSAHPYSLLTIAPHAFICSERTMAEHEPLPVVTLAEEEAKRLRVRNEDVVLVESPTGAVRARLRTRAGQRRDIVVAERGGWPKAGHELNRLTRDMASRVENGTPYYETRVNIRHDG